MGLADIDWGQLGTLIDQANQPPAGRVPATYTPVGEEFPQTTYIKPPLPGVTFRDPPQSTPSTPSYNPPSYNPPSYNPPSYSPPSYNPPSTFTPYFPRAPTSTPPWTFNPPIDVFTPGKPSTPSSPPKTSPPSSGGSPPSTQTAPPQQQMPGLGQLSQQMALMVAPQQNVVVGGANGQPLPFQADRSFRGKDPGINQNRSKNYLDMIRAGFQGGG